MRIASLSPTFRHPSAALPLLLAGVWLLTMLTFTPLEREDITSVDSVDFLAKAKIVARLGTLAVLIWLVLRSRIETRLAWLLLPLGLFLFWAMTSTLWSPLKAVSLGQSLSLASLVLLSWCLAGYGNRPDDTSRILAHAATALWIFSLCLLAAWFTLGDGSDRFGFAVAHPTMAGASASMGIVLTSAAATIWRWRWARMLIGPALLTHAAVLVLAHNRTAMVVTALAVMLLLAAFADRRTLMAAGLAASIAAIAAVVLDPGWIFFAESIGAASEFFSRDQHKSELLGFSGRDQLWTIMWESHFQAPWIGHGYFVSSRDGVLDIWNRAANFNAHNMPFQALVSTGIVGAVLFVWAMLQPVGYALWNLGGSSETARRAGLFLLLSAWLWTWGMMDAALLGPVAPFCVAFFVALGLLGGAACQRGRRSGMPQPPPEPAVLSRRFQLPGGAP